MRSARWNNRLITGAVAMIVALVVGLGPSAAAAQAPQAPAAEAPAAPSVSVDDLEALAASIEDEAKREALLGQIRALIEVAKGTRPEEEDLSLGSRVIATLSATTAQISHQIVAAANRMSNLPVLVGWFDRQITDPESRSAWLFGLLKLAAVALAGWLAERLVGLLLARPRRALSGRDANGWLVEVPLLVARILVEMVPVAAFAVVAYAVLPLLHPAPETRVLVITFLSAYVLIRVLIILMRMILVPPEPSHRRLPIEGETAHYLFIWARRLIVTWVAGYYIIQAALLLGLPPVAYAGLLRVLGLLLTAMVVVFLLQNRAAVGDWIRGRPPVGAPLSAGARLRRRLGDVWHVLAILYVIGVFAVWAFDIEGGFGYLLRATVTSAVILIAARLLTGLLGRAIDRGFAVGDDVKHRFPQLEARVNRYVPLVHTVLRVVIGVLAVLALLQAWGVDTLGWLESPAGRRVAGSAFSIAIILIGALVLWEAASSSIERYLTQTDAHGMLIERSARARTLLPLLRNALMVVLLVMVTLIVLSELGVNIGPLLAGAGVVGLAIGFGSQKLVQDVINGVFILFEDSLAVGNVVTAGGISGLVEQISIRSLRLRAFDGTVHTIPFSSVDTVSNMTKDYSMAVIEAGVGYRENIDEVMEVLKQLGVEMRSDPTFGPAILEPLEMVGVDDLAESAVVIKCRFKTLPLKQWSVLREFRRRMKNRFDELGIEIPFPHRTLYVWEGKGDRPPPTYMQVLKTSPARAAGAEKSEPAVPGPEASERGPEPKPGP